MGDLVSLCITTYNRSSLLKKCIESFFRTNAYPLEDLEVIIIDNGSTDVSVAEYLGSLSLDVPSTVHRVEKNVYPEGMKEAKNIARNIAKGDYFIDCPDDHLFVVTSDWIKDSISIMNKFNNVGCIIHFAYPQYRFQKSNNAMHRVSDNFFESKLKGYADYHIMSREVFEKVGSFNTIDGYKTEGDYMDRALAAGYKRYMMEFPVAIINEGNLDIPKPISYKSLQLACGMNQPHPISNEMLTKVIRRINNV